MQAAVSNSNAAPHQRAALGYGSGNEITDAHERAIIEHESTPVDANAVANVMLPSVEDSAFHPCAFGGSASPKTMVRTFRRRREFREPAERGVAKAPPSKPDPLKPEYECLVAGGVSQGLSIRA